MSKKTVRRRRQNFTQETLKRKEGFKYKLIADRKSTRLNSSH